MRETEYMRVTRLRRLWGWLAAGLAAALVCGTAYRFTVAWAGLVVAGFLVATWRHEHYRGWIAGYRTREREERPL